MGVDDTKRILYKEDKRLQFPMMGTNFPFERGNYKNQEGIYSDLRTS